MENMYKQLQILLDNEACQLQSLTESIKANLDYATQKNYAVKIKVLTHLSENLLSLEAESKKVIDERKQNDLIHQNKMKAKYN